MDNPTQESTGSPAPTSTPPPAEATFTQADVDRIVRDRVQRERQKFSDYDDLKARAGEAQTAEQRIAQLEEQYESARIDALRASVASAHGITPEDRDLFLVGTTEEVLTAQAKRLSERSAPPRGVPSPAEGTNSRPPEDEMRAFTRSLFRRDT